MIWQLLLRLLPGDLRQSIAGDLEEEVRPLRARFGGLAANVWLTVTTFKLAIRFQVERFYRGRPLAPIRDEIRRDHRMFETLRQDITFGLRMMKRHPAFTAVAILALTLGIGANTAIFSVANAVLWRPLPYSQPDRIMQIAEQRVKEGRDFGPVSPADYFDWRHDSTSFVSMAAYMGDVANLSGEGEPERVHTLIVSAPFLSVLGVAPIYGRDFQAEEEIDGRDHVAILSDGFWRRRFGSDPSVVGRNVQVDGNAFQVIGVLPSSFWWRTDADMLVPLALTQHDRGLRTAHFLDVIARLRSDVPAQRAADELKSIGQRLVQAFPDANTGHEPNMRPFREALIGEVRPAFAILLGTTGFVLLIACTNVATLLLARAGARRREMAVRRATGASRRRLVQQMLTESLVLAVLGGAAGVTVAAWSVRAIRQVLPDQIRNLPGISAVALDSRILLGGLVLSTLTGMLFGIGPALAASRQDVGATLDEEARGNSSGVQTLRFRSVLIVTQVALALVLLVGAGLLTVSFRNLLQVSPGFQAANIVAADISLPMKRYPNTVARTAFFETLYNRLRSIPSTSGVAATASLPFSGDDTRLDLDFANHTIEHSTPVRAHPRLVSTEYLRVMGIPLLSGRAFSEHDNTNSPPVVLINDAAARQYWPGENPIGQRISLGSPERWMEIIGIAGNVHHDGLESEPVPEAYIPQRQGFNALGNGFGLYMSVIVRTSADLSTAASSIRAAVREIDAEQPIGSIQTMNSVIDESVAPRRLGLILMLAFAVLAMVLTAAGIYGVMSYLVVQRTREIGVRMALGATRWQILRMIFGQAGTMMVIGLALGVSGSLLLTRWISGMLFGVSRTSVPIYAAVCLLLVVVAVIAIAVPSKRAMRVDPLAALRDS